MAGEAERHVPEGAAVFPVIPDELGVDPLLLAVLHAAVFLDGSEESILNHEAAREAMGYLIDYLRRLKGPRLQQVREDFACLAAYAREQKWSKVQVRFLKEFLDNYEIGEFPV
jgi:hypothetical protein